ncbi:MAG: hypothetical protein ACLFNA_02325 [Halochromatium sp.]|uniref:hypothetical protein n=1 Tax=Halochromatium sp. TaxID=2049430 RepID=UPI003979AD5D
MTINSPPDFTLGADPDWDSPLTFKLTPELIAHALMETASTVHTGWESCIDEDAILSQVAVMDETGDKSLRLIEQDFVDEQDNTLAWHDWTLEVRVGAVFILAHWQVRANAPVVDWEWSAAAAEHAFERASVLLGRRVRRSLVVEEPQRPELPPRSSRH